MNTKAICKCLQNSCIKTIIYFKIALVFNWMNGNRVKRIIQASLEVLKISKPIQFFKMPTTKFNIYTYLHEESFIEWIKKIKQKKKVFKKKNRNQVTLL